MYTKYISNNTIRYWNDYWDEEIIKDIVSDITKNNYSDGTCFIEQYELLIPVNKDTTLLSFQLEYEKVAKAQKEKDKKNKFLEEQAISVWSTKNPKEKEAIDQQNKIDTELINSTYLHNINDFMQELRAIPNNISREEKLIQVIVLLLKVSPSITLPQEHEQQMKYAIDISSTLKGLGFSKQEYNDIPYSKSSTQQNTKFAEDVICNFIDPTYSAHPLYNLFIISETFSTEALNWLCLNTNTTPLPKDIIDPRPSYEDINYENADGDTITLHPGTYTPYFKTSINYTNSQTDLLKAQLITSLYQKTRNVPTM